MSTCCRPRGRNHRRIVRSLVLSKRSKNPASSWRTRDSSTRCPKSARMEEAKQTIRNELFSSTTPSVFQQGRTGTRPNFRIDQVSREGSQEIIGTGTKSPSERRTKTDPPPASKRHRKREDSHATAAINEDTQKYLLPVIYCSSTTNVFSEIPTSPTLKMLSAEKPSLGLPLNFSVRS